MEKSEEFLFQKFYPKKLLKLDIMIVPSMIGHSDKTVKNA